MPVVPQNVGFQDPGVSFMMPSLPSASGMQQLPLQQVPGRAEPAEPAAAASAGDADADGHAADARRAAAAGLQRHDGRRARRAARAGRRRAW